MMYGGMDGKVNEVDGWVGGWVGTWINEWSDPLCG